MKDIILIALIVYTLLSLCISIFLTNIMIEKKRMTYQRAEEREKLKGNIEDNFIKSFEEEQCFIDSPHGYKLYCRFHMVENAKATAVLMHGHGGNLIYSYKYCRLFERLHINWFIFDNRNAGKSGGKFTSMGYYERDDYIAVLNFARSKSKGLPLGLMGESMGASTALLVLDKEKVDFVIEDCGYSTLKEEVIFQAWKNHVFKFPVYFLASLYCKVRYGFFFREVSPLKSVKREEVSSVPILFIHGEKDPKTPVRMARELFEGKKGKKKLYIHPQALHARTYEADKETYFAVWQDFFNEFEII